jgi:hypothetical protein
MTRFGHNLHYSPVTIESGTNAACNCNALYSYKLTDVKESLLISMEAWLDDPVLGQMFVLGQVLITVGQELVIGAHNPIDQYLTLRILEDSNHALGVHGQHIF